MNICQWCNTNSTQKHGYIMFFVHPPTGQRFMAGVCDSCHDELRKKYPIKKRGKRA
jgi:hypothetical protein